MKRLCVLLLVLLALAGCGSATHYGAALYLFRKDGVEYAKVVTGSIPASDYERVQVCPRGRSQAESCLRVKRLKKGIKLHTTTVKVTKGLFGGIYNGKKGATPTEIRTAYEIPAPNQTAESTVTIGVLEEYGDVWLEESLNGYSAAFGLPLCTKANGCLHEYLLNGEPASNRVPHSLAEAREAREGHGSAITKILTEEEGAESATIEAAMDVEMEHAMCPYCKLTIVYQPREATNKQQGEAESELVTKGAEVVAASWGEPEANATQTEQEENSTKYWTHPNVAVVNAGGDKGATVWIPADYPKVVSVGSTEITFNSEGIRTAEKSWTDSGHACSKYLHAEAWQESVKGWSATGCGTKRGVTDIEAIGGFGSVLVYNTAVVNSDGYWVVTGGTSGAAQVIGGIFGTTYAAWKSYTYPAELLYKNFAEHPKDFHPLSGETEGTYTLKGGMGSPQGVAGFE